MTAKDDLQIQATLPSKKAHQALRKRKLIVDESIEIPSKNIMAQLKDTSDIIKPVKNISYIDSDLLFSIYILMGFGLD